MYAKVTEESLTSLNYAPDTTIEDAVQCLTALAVTPKGSVPLECDMGMPMEYLHKGTIAGQVRYESELVEQMDKYEPRLTLTGATYDWSSGDTLIPTLEVELSG